MTEQRVQLRKAFLVSQGLATAAIQPLQPDASFRRYFRIDHKGQRWMLMDAPPAHENIRAFVAIAQHLQRLGLRPPTVQATDLEHGFALLEDLGDDTYTHLLANGIDETELYSLAIDVLRYLHGHPQAVDLERPAYSQSRLLDEALLLVDWYWPAVHGNPASAPVRETYLQIWRDILCELPAVPQTLVLRDFHVDNLLRVAGRARVQQCALLDFQDAVLGPAAYDVVSLLEDARRDLAPSLATAMLERYLHAATATEREQFMHGYTVLGAQRHCKVIGIFQRLCRRDGKCHYLIHLPRIKRLLQVHLQQPCLVSLRDWLMRYQLA